MSKTAQRIWELLAMRHYSLEEGCDAYVELAKQWPKIADEIAAKDAEILKLNALLDRALVTAERGCICPQSHKGFACASCKELRDIRAARGGGKGEG